LLLLLHSTDQLGKYSKRAKRKEGRKEGGKEGKKKRIQQQPCRRRSEIKVDCHWCKEAKREGGHFRN
jgi:hypothetical protein